MFVRFASKVISSGRARLTKMEGAANQKYHLINASETPLSDELVGMVASVRLPLRKPSGLIAVHLSSGNARTTTDQPSRQERADLFHRFSAVQVQRGRLVISSKALFCLEPPALSAALAWGLAGRQQLPLRFLWLLLYLVLFLLIIVICARLGTGFEEAILISFLGTILLMTSTVGYLDDPTRRQLLLRGYGMWQRSAPGEARPYVAFLLWIVLYRFYLREKLWPQWTWFRGSFPFLKELARLAENEREDLQLMLEREIDSEPDADNLRLLRDYSQITAALASKSAPVPTPRPL